MIHQPTGGQKIWGGAVINFNHIVEEIPGNEMTVEMLMKRIENMQSIEQKLRRHIEHLHEDRNKWRDIAERLAESCPSYDAIFDYIKAVRGG
jgi:benzoyl-CoA reductase/2-hydroxyglutaryl-CoA dehydratase subunit BcrC/BadD/HgdB